ncbi:adenylate/guanylate cyclase domain-containing protein [Mycobacterium sp. ITM-2016-00318]|uniref:adenylate/guanylate cyclase domain-containing protein n=1 Tax=Mycobacterium sp. ITM-2016-00318 TaxID=2099693 RepID=UPI000CF94C86|nr:adenylate/guanylate cyclase domain-containing protein [Mycobacterium sp. ITM-2016-00318]WNG91677.1 adenylate/guanylate cyclase domain-containing protein [Mycobacterium sp. ITM-2016-00318]
MGAPDTRYAKKGEISIAYQVVGDGPINLVLVNGIVSHMALMWSDPQANAMLRRLTSFARLIMFDKPGTGLSDPVAGPPSVEQRVEDITAVMDAVGVERAWLLGYSEGGTPSVLFAAIHPQRCDGLVLMETAAKWLSEPDYLPEYSSLFQGMWTQMLGEATEWGAGKVFALWAPSAVSVPGSTQVFGSAERICASPGMAIALLKSTTHMDVRSVLPRISAPTLVVNREDSFVRVELGRYLAEQIPRARHAVFPGADHLVWVGDWEPIVDEIEEFLTGARHRSDPDRALVTILFTDIVSSTEHTSEMGDERWRALVERHDDVVRAEIARYGGRTVKTLGDGILAVFDGPAKAIRAARAMNEAVRGLGIEIRAGVHTGECDRRGEDLAGIAVNVAARIVSYAGAGEIFASSTVRELVLGSGLEFVERGTYTLKGVPDEWHLFAVTGDGRTDSRPVNEVDPSVAALTPGPMQTLRPRDRLLLTAAHRVPGVLRKAGRPLLYPKRPWTRSKLS